MCCLQVKSGALRMTDVLDASRDVRAITMVLSCVDARGVICVTMVMRAECCDDKCSRRVWTDIAPRLKRMA